MATFTSVGKVLKKMAPKSRVRYEKICRCGHSKTMHESYPAGVAPGVPSGTVCLLCDCAEWRYGSRRRMAA